MRKETRAWMGGVSEHICEGYKKKRNEVLGRAKGKFTSFGLSQCKTKPRAWFSLSW